MKDTQDPLAVAVIRAFGGITKMAEATGWPTSTIHSAQRNGFVEWRRERIVVFAARMGIDLPPEVLASLPSEAA